MRTSRRLAARLARAVATSSVTVLPLGCGSADDAGSATTASAAAASSAPATSGRCLVRLHGKGSSGTDTIVDGDVTIVAPTGNSDGWGARQWLYFPDDEYVAARRIIADSVAGCEQVIVNGFSNGGSFAASLYCHGETFDGRLVGVVVDDPVTDRAVDRCAPDPSVAVTLYATGALEGTAVPGWSCAEADWTCEGGETIGIDAYAEALGTEARKSPFTEHEWYVDAPEVSAWR
jgi:hypothetical protein